VLYSVLVFGLTPGRWSYVEYVSVFNEAVNDARATVSEVAIAITYVKTQLPPFIPVTTIDTFTAYINNPTLCNVGQDFVAANVQPYFSAVEPSQAGNYVVQQMYNVAQTCEVSSVQITGNTPWPPLPLVVR
jgi:exo-beta-1,3-glucanase (GH17 family)